VVVAVVAWSIVGPIAVCVIAAAPALIAVGARRRLRRRSARARDQLRLAVLELAELVSLGIGAGLGVPAALDRAATLLRGTAGEWLRVVATSGPEPWLSLETLGERVAVSELGDFARTLTVGVEHQARTRQVLLSWAQAARAARREHDMAAAAATTEAMTGPLALVGFGFLLVVGVPAALQLLSGVGQTRF
jgi:Flp pilus assembly protein TadB